MNATNDMAETRHGGDPGLAAALAADLDAGFVELFGVYRHVVFSTALRVSGRWADAEDLAAEAFLRAYRALSGYAPERIAGLRLKPWLLTILLNEWRNRRRAADRSPPPAPLENVPEPQEQAEGAERLAERHETSRELAALLAQLPERQRLAVVLRHVAELSTAEVADVLGCPEGTAKSHVSRGLRRLRELHSSPAAGSTSTSLGGAS
ncbi:RNA polymerase sigma factor [Salinactinospora qingdaonensis]|uniref:RNA polymerase sigma factor n=1 Tax=Salinactinospora qingdaonensis TaxID=702744 RepID=UPI0031EDF759